MEDTQTINTDSTEQEQDPNASIKTRLANLLINRVALSECLNVIRDACMQRAGDIVDNASEEDMKNILKDIDAFENPPEPKEGSTETSQSAAGPVGSSDVTPVQDSSGPA
jgi:hypothetical protein